MMHLYGTHEKLLDKIQKAGIVLRPNTPELKDYFFRLKKALEENGIEPILDKNSANMIGIDGEEWDKLCKSVDIFISVGGDGTLISTVRNSFEYQKPTLGINMGRLGFLTDIQKDEIESFAKKLVNKEYRIDKRMVLEVELKSKNKKMFALNDLVITRKHISKMVHIKASIDNKPFNTYYGDGLIISTPTGSTAYNISAGGPLIYPFSQIFVITPICPHSLTQRPLVLPASFEIDIEINDDEKAAAVLDGQEVCELYPKEVLSVKIAKLHALLIHKKERSFFAVLKEKFRWGEN